MNPRQHTSIKSNFYMKVNISSWPAVIWKKDHLLYVTCDLEQLFSLLLLWIILSVDVPSQDCSLRRCGCEPSRVLGLDALKQSLADTMGTEVSKPIWSSLRQQEELWDIGVWLCWSTDWCCADFWWCSVDVCRAERWRAVDQCNELQWRAKEWINLEAKQKNLHHWIPV